MCYQSGIQKHLFIRFTMAHKMTNVFSLSHYTLGVTSFIQNEGILVTGWLRLTLTGSLCDTLGPGRPSMPAPPLLPGAGRPPSGGWRRSQGLRPGPQPAHPQLWRRAEEGGGDEIQDAAGQAAQEERIHCWWEAYSIQQLNFYDKKSRNHLNYELLDF